MQITLLSVGKPKDAHYRDAAQNYIKRLKHYAAFDEIVVREERVRKNALASDIQKKKAIASCAPCAPMLWSSPSTRPGNCAVPKRWPSVYPI